MDSDVTTSDAGEHRIPAGGGRVPRVSMVLPVHNGAAFLEAAIASVLAQSLADFELICVDDASSDQSPAILAAAAAGDPRVRIITLAPNRGLPAALNAGFAQAGAPLHSWTSDDNLLRPTMLERLVGALDAHPDADIAHADFMLIDANGTLIERNVVSGPETLLDCNNIGACFLYRAAVTEALGGYDETLFGVEDYDFWLRAARRFRFHAVHEDLYLYRKHEGSLTSRRARRIHDLNRRIVMRELALETDPRRAAAILRNLVARDPWHWNGALIARALRLAPRDTLAALPSVLRRLASGYRHRMRTRER